MAGMDALATRQPPTAQGAAVFTLSPAIERVWLHGELIPKSELAAAIAKHAKREPLTPCKWRGIFRGGGE
jgi:hypothetical protein